MKIPVTSVSLHTGIGNLIDLLKKQLQNGNKILQKILLYKSYLQNRVFLLEFVSQSDVLYIKNAFHASPIFNGTNWIYVEFGACSLRLEI